MMMVVVVGVLVVPPYSVHRRWRWEIGDGDGDGGGVDDAHASMPWACGDGNVHNCISALSTNGKGHASTDKDRAPRLAVLPSFSSA